MLDRERERALHMHLCVCVRVSVCLVISICSTSPNTQEDVLSEVAKSEADVISYLDQINRYESLTVA